MHFSASARHTLQDVGQACAGRLGNVDSGRSDGRTGFNVAESLTYRSSAFHEVICCVIPTSTTFPQSKWYGSIST